MLWPASFRYSPMGPQKTAMRASRSPTPALGSESDPRAGDPRIAPLRRASNRCQACPRSGPPASRPRLRFEFSGARSRGVNVRYIEVRSGVGHAYSGSEPPVSADNRRSTARVWHGVPPLPSEYAGAPPATGCHHRDERLAGQIPGDQHCVHLVDVRARRVEELAPDTLGGVDVGADLGNSEDGVAQDAPQGPRGMATSTSLAQRPGAAPGSRGGGQEVSAFAGHPSPEPGVRAERNEADRPDVSSPFW